MRREFGDGLARPRTGIKISNLAGLQRNNVTMCFQERLLCEACDPILEQLCLSLAGGYRLALIATQLSGAAEVSFTRQDLLNKRPRRSMCRSPSQSCWRLHYKALLPNRACGRVGCHRRA